MGPSWRSHCNSNLESCSVVVGIKVEWMRRWLSQFRAHYRVEPVRSYENYLVVAEFVQSPAISPWLSLMAKCTLRVYHKDDELVNKCYSTLVIRPGYPATNSHFSFAHVEWTDSNVSVECLFLVSSKVPS